MTRRVAPFVALLAATPLVAAPFLLAQSKVPGDIVRGKHLSVRLTTSGAVAVPGQRISLAAAITPDPKIHVYAPGQEGYIPVELKLDANVELKAEPANYPPSRPFFYEPLKETVKVYDRPFTITNGITLSTSAALSKRAADKEALTLTGSLYYQACDDTVCYRPDTVALRWTIALAPNK